MRWLLFSCVLVVLSGEVFCKYKYSWSNANLHCRSEDNEPLDWWFIYKPPAEWLDGAGGRSYVFLSSDNPEGDFNTAKIKINRQSMPFFTMNPWFRATYSLHLAKLQFSYHKANQSSEQTMTSYLMADMLSGVWMGTTVRDYIQEGVSRPDFSIDEIQRGQTMFCLSISLEVADALGSILRSTDTDVSRMYVGEEMEQLVPGWRQGSQENYSIKDTAIQKIHFLTRGGLAVVALFSRWGTRAKLAQAFAQQFGVGLDVYEDTGANGTCRGNIRQIRQVSIKTPDHSYVNYVERSQDRSFFAVSTPRGRRAGAGWQGAGEAVEEHWACFGSSDQDTWQGEGGLLLCVANEAVWRALTNLKVAEPTC